MKRRILFALLCMGMLFIGAIVYAGLVYSDTTSMLSDREMASITGKCCYLMKHIDCRVYGDLTCSATGVCSPTATERFHDPYRYVCIAGPANDMKCSPGTVACFTPTNVVDLGWVSNYICSMLPPPGYDPSEYAGYYLWCDMFPPANCKRCGWGSPAGATFMALNCGCVPI